MNAKLTALLTAAISGITGFLSFLANTPPEQQSELLGWIVEAMPLEWRPTIALYGTGISRVMLAYSIYKAAQSGPKNPTP